jgi:uncharacterized membrane protein
MISRSIDGRGVSWIEGMGRIVGKPGPPPDAEEPGMNRRAKASAGTHLGLSLLAGVLAGAAARPAADWETAGLVSWVVAASVFLLWTWTAVWPMSAQNTAQLAQREDPTRVLRDVVLLVVAVGAMTAVAGVIFHAHQTGALHTSLGVASVAASWAVLHTILTLRYARLYYTEPKGGVDFKQAADPTYRDFAYLAFTVGMTFQVSDTDIGKPAIRETILRHALMSFLFGAVIIAVTINLVAGLSK